MQKNLFFGDFFNFLVHYSRMESLKETTIKSQLVFQGKFLRLFVDQVQLPDQTQSTREFIDHPGAAMIIPIIKNKSGQNELLMVRQFRYPLKKEFFEFPAGKVDPGETALQTAQRELIEETGYEALRMQALTQIHPVIGYSNEKIEIFMGWDLVFKGRNLQENEFLDLVSFSEEKIESLIWQQELTDVKSQVGFFWYQHMKQSVLS